VAKPTTDVKQSESVQGEQGQKSLQEIQQVFDTYGDAIESFLVVLQDLHHSGLLEMVHSLLNAKEKVASIALEQVLKPSVLNTIKNAMSALAMVSKLNPDQLSTLTEAVVAGLHQGQERLDGGKRVGVIDLAKAMRNPDINRTLALLLGVLQGMGQKL
jgi:uncharacterized protein YjgD (DUF1641 family)